MTNKIDPEDCIASRLIIAGSIKLPTVCKTIRCLKLTFKNKIKNET